MKCNRCGRELRIVSEIVGYNRNNIPLRKRMGYCDLCRTKTDVEFALSMKQRDKNIAIFAIVIVLLLGGLFLITLSNATFNGFNNEIEYEEIKADTLLDILEENPLRAETLYNGEYLEITGEISNIDSDGSYICIVRTDGKKGYGRIQCFITTTEQLNKVIDMKIGDTVIVEGKMKEVGEIIGYLFDMDNLELVEE